MSLGFGFYISQTRQYHRYHLQVKSSVDCEEKSREDCQTIEWEECHEKPKVICKKTLVGDPGIQHKTHWDTLSNVQVHRPTQEFVHKKKCLVTKDTSYVCYVMPCHIMSCYVMFAFDFHFPFPVFLIFQFPSPSGLP